MNKELFDRIIACVWKTIEEGGDIDNIDHLAERCNLDKSILQKLFPTREKIALVLIEDIWQKLSLPPKSDKLAPRDQIFDAVMMVFDLITPYRLGLKKLTHNLLLSPTTYFEIAPRLNRFGSDLVKHYYNNEGIFALAIPLAFNTAFGAAFWTFLDDDTFDLSKTMASLDASLKTVTSLLSYCPGKGKFE
jgi:hypothetical protein